MIIRNIEVNDAEEFLNFSKLLNEGTIVIKQCEAWAREHNKQRLELTVMLHNELAIKL